MREGLSTSDNSADEFSEGVITRAEVILTAIQIKDKSASREEILQEKLDSLQKIDPKKCSSLEKIQRLEHLLISFKCNPADSCLYEQAASSCEQQVEEWLQETAKASPSMKKMLESTELPKSEKLVHIRQLGVGKTSVGSTIVDKVIQSITEEFVENGIKTSSSVKDLEQEPWTTPRRQTKQDTDDRPGETTV